MIKLHFIPLLLIFILFGSCQTKTTLNPAAQAFNTEQIKAELHASTEGWNQGNLTNFMATYDSAATFMTSKGLINLAQLRSHYQQKYFVGNQPRQKLAFEELAVKPLGTEFALVTGKFILSGNDQPEQSGRFSLIFHATKNGWKILHDHSS